MCIFAIWKAVKVLFCTSGESLIPTSGTSSKNYCCFKLHGSLHITSEFSDFFLKNKQTNKDIERILHLKKQ